MARMKNQVRSVKDKVRYMVSHSMNYRFDMKDNKRLLAGLKQKSDLI